MTIAQFHPVKKGGMLYQLYKVDYNAPVKIGGLSEWGYMLRFWDGKESGTCLTVKNIEDIEQGDVTKVGNFNYQKVY